MISTHTTRAFAVLVAWAMIGACGEPAASDEDAAVDGESDGSVVSDGGQDGSVGNGLVLSALGCHTALRTTIPLPNVRLPGFGPAVPVVGVNTACPEDAPEISGDGNRLYMTYGSYHDWTTVDIFAESEVRVFERVGDAWDGPYVYPVHKGTTTSLVGEVSHTSPGDKV